MLGGYDGRRRRERLVHASTPSRVQNLATSRNTRSHMTAFGAQGGDGYPQSSVPPHRDFQGDLPRDLAGKSPTFAHARVRSAFAW